MEEVNKLVDFIEKNCFDLCLNMNDTFCYACADGEDIERGELKIVFELYKKYESIGLDAFVAVARGYKLSELLPIYLKGDKKGIETYKKAYKECKDNYNEYYNISARKTNDKHQDVTNTKKNRINPTSEEDIVSNIANNLARLSIENKKKCIDIINWQIKIV